MLLLSVVCYVVAVVVVGMVVVCLAAAVGVGFCVVDVAVVTVVIYD